MWKGSPILQESSIIALEKSVENFVMFSISDMPTNKYWQNLVTYMDTAKENIPKKYRIGGTYFTSLETIGGNLLTINSKNSDYVQKDSNDILSVIIISGTYVLGGETVF